MFDTEKFIHEIEQRPAIWNLACREYSNKVYKSKEWEDLCLIFIENFNNLQKDEKNKEAIGLQKKWKNIRDQYRRQSRKKKTLKSGSGASPSTKEYIYFQQLSFLAPMTEMKLSQEENQSFIEDSEKDDTQIEKVIRQKSPKKYKKKKLNEEDALINALSMNISREINESKQNDPDKLFLLSLLAPLKTLPEHAKLDYKCEVMQLLKKYQIQYPRDQPLPPQNYPQTYYQPASSHFFQMFPSTSNYNALGGAQNTQTLNHRFAEIPTQQEFIASPIKSESVSSDTNSIIEEMF